MKISNNFYNPDPRWGTPTSTSNYSVSWSNNTIGPNEGDGLAGVREPLVPIQPLDSGSMAPALPGDR